MLGGREVGRESMSMSYFVPFDAGELMTGTRLVPSSPSDAGGSGSPESSTRVGKMSINPAKAQVRCPSDAVIQGARMISGTRASNSQLVHFDQSPCSPSFRGRRLRRHQEGMMTES